MFWTHWVRGYNKVILIIGILASVITGFAGAAEEPAMLLIIPIGVIVVLSSVSVLMMISEISVFLDEINKKLGSQGGSYSGSLINEQSSPYSGSLFKDQTSSTDTSTARGDTTWVCNCGARNSASAIFCKKCGKRHEGGTTSTRWTCPECGESNPNSTRVCRSCAYQK